MRAKTLLALLFVASLGVVALCLLRTSPQQVAAVIARPIEVHEILAAAGPLERGTLLRAQDLTWKAIAVPPQPEQIVRPAAAERAAKPDLEAKALVDVQGAALRGRIPRGQPILRGELVRPGDREFLGVVLVPGSRAIAIPLPAGIGILSPGDHVDVILTQTFRGDTPLTRRSVSETVAEDLRVLAIDPGAAANRNLTLEVSPEQAEHINVAGELGKLSLTLRSGDRPEAAARQVRPAWAGDVSAALRGASVPAAAPQPPVVSPSIDVIRGNHAEKVKSE